MERYRADRRASRALPWLAYAMIATCALSGAPAQNLDEGKSGSQLFAANCSICHRSPQGLAANIDAQSLSEFLQQHYTSDGNSAVSLTDYLLGSHARPDGRSKSTITRRDRPTIERPVRSLGGHPDLKRGDPAARRTATERQHDLSKRDDALHRACPERYSCYPLYGGYGP
jgi:mono/diheme cytochrome c family protein